MPERERKVERTGWTAAAAPFVCSRAGPLGVSGSFLFSYQNTCTVKHFVGVFVGCRIDVCAVVRFRPGEIDTLRLRRGEKLGHEHPRARHLASTYGLSSAAIPLQILADRLQCTYYIRLKRRSIVPEPARPTRMGSGVSLDLNDDYS